MPLIQDYVDIIKSLNRMITELLVKRKEEVVDRLIGQLNE